MSDSFQKDAFSVSDAELKHRREQIRRGLTRANTAAAVILLIVISLSLAAMLQAVRAERHAREASLAGQRAEEELWRAKLAQARAQRLSSLAGRKAESLAAVTSAAGMHPSLELRDEAIAALALADVAEEGSWQDARIYTPDTPAFAPDLDRYALGKTSGEVLVHRMATGEKVAHLRGPRSPAAEPRFSPNGQLLGVSFANGEVMVWNLTNDAPVFVRKSRPFPASGMSFDFSPDSGKVAITDGTNGVQLFNLESGAESKTLPLAGNSTGVSFRPDGQAIAVSVASNIVVWSLAEGRVMQMLPHSKNMAYFAWHSDGQRLASSCAQSLEAWLWDTKTTNSLLLKGHLELVSHLNFSHRGDVLMSAAADGSTRFWDGGSGELLFVSRAGFGWQFSRDDKRIGYLRENQGLGVWKVSSSTVFRTMHLPLSSTRQIAGFDFSPDGRWLVAANAEGAHLYDLSTGVPLAYASHRNNHSVWFAADGERIVLVGADHLHTWQLMQTRNEVQLQDKGRFEFQPRARLDAGSVSHGSRHLLTVPSLDKVFCVDLSAPDQWWALPGKGLIGYINSAAISPDTNWIATTFWKDRGTFVWDTRTRERVYSFGASGGFVTFSPDSRRLLVASAHHYALWETGTWRRLWEVTRHSAGELVGRGAFSADGRVIALCPEVNLLQLVETETGQKIAALQAPVPKNIGPVAFSPDGQTLAVGTFDTEIQIWDLAETRRQLATLGLDWNADLKSESSLLAINPAASGSAYLPFRADPSRSARASSGGTFYLLAGLGVLVAVFTGGYTVRYHQRMMRSYEEIDHLATQRAAELQVAHVELLHSQKMKALGTLAAGIAHDFNNLLSVIRMGNNFLRRPDISSEDKVESGAAVERAVEQGKKVVQSMLGYSREPSEGRQTYSVPELVDEVVLLLSQQFLGSLTLTLELNRDTPPVAVSRGRLEQILLNLIVNAVEAMEGKGRLRIAVREVTAANDDFILRPRTAASFVELLVADTGPGIDASVRGRIFEPFFSTKPQSASSGTGLGLSLVHSLAEQERMGIVLESTPGHGTVFRIFVPVELASAPVLANAS